MIKDSYRYVLNRYVGLETELITTDAEIRGIALVKTGTIKNRVLLHIQVPEDEEVAHWLDVALGQAIQQELYRRGCMALQRGLGYFICLDKCTDISFLKQLFDNKVEDIETDIGLKEEIIKLGKERFGNDRQMEFDLADPTLQTYRQKMSADEYIDFLEANAI